MVGSVFWLKFIIKDTFNCDSGDPTIDCFSIDNDTFGYSIDCSDYNATDIVCFKFALEIGKAVGTAGGILTISTIMFGATSGILLAISEGKDGGKKRHCCACICQTSIFLVATLLFTGMLIAISFLKSTMYEKITQYFELITFYELVLISCSFMPWSKFYKKLAHSPITKGEGQTYDNINTPETTPLVNPT